MPRLYQSSVQKRKVTAAYILEYESAQCLLEVHTSNQLKQGHYDFSALWRPTSTKADPKKRHSLFEIGETPEIRVEVWNDYILWTAGKWEEERQSAVS